MTSQRVAYHRVRSTHKSRARKVREKPEKRRRRREIQTSREEEGGKARRRKAERRGWSLRGEFASSHLAKTCPPSPCPQGPSSVATGVRPGTENTLASPFPLPQNALCISALEDFIPKDLRSWSPNREHIDPNCDPKSHVTNTQWFRWRVMLVALGPSHEDSLVGSLSPRGISTDL